MKKNSSIRYFATATVLKIFSSTAFSRRLYRYLGNNLGQRHTTASKVELERGKRLIQKINEAGFSPDKELTVLELGTGWTHFYAIILGLFLNAKITLFDVQDNRNFASLKQRCTNLLTILPAIQTHGIPSVEELEKAQELLMNIIALDSFEEFYQLLNMTYLIDPNGRLDLLSDKAFDIVFSVDVIEHIDRDSVESTLHGLYRILKPGGISVHQIGLDDHLSHYVPGAPSKNYMQYSTSTWKLYFENRLQYINRLQLPEILSSFDASGFKLIQCQTEEDASLDRIRPDSEFLRFDSSALMATRAYLVHRKPTL